MDAPPLAHDAATLIARTEKPKQPTKFARQLHDLPGKRESSILFIYTAESILFGRKNPLQGIGLLMKLCCLKYRVYPHSGTRNLLREYWNAKSALAVP